MIPLCDPLPLLNDPLQVTPMKVQMFCSIYGKLFLNIIHLYMDYLFDINYKQNTNLSKLNHVVF